MMDAESAEVADIWAKLRRQSWPRLLKKVYEVDPFVWPKCKETRRQEDKVGGGASRIHAIFWIVLKQGLTIEAD